MIVKRDRYLDKLIRSKGNGLIKIITGIRRVGKSFLLKQLFRQHLIESGVAEDHILMISLEDRRQKSLRDPDALLQWIDERLIDQEVYYVIIDEVQEVESFTEVLSSLYVTDRVDVYVTGSNSHLLSSDVVTEFRGRGDEIHIWPLSFGEFMSAYEGSKEEGWAEYMHYGGLPQLLSQRGDDRKQALLQSIYRTVYLRDIVERYDIVEMADFEELSRVMASSIGGLVSSQKIANTFASSGSGTSITDKTVTTYLGYMQEAFLLERADRYDLKGRKYIGAPSKYYYKDVGLRNAILSFRQYEPTHIMENIIYNEMRLRGWQVDVGSISHRMREDDGSQVRRTLEVDFVCNRGSERLYIQSAWRIPTEEKMEQEKRSLGLIDDSFRKIVVVGEPMKPWSDDSGIRMMSVYDFLLSDKW